MLLIQIGIQVIYKEEIPAYHPSQTVFEALGGTVKRPESSIETGMRIRIPNDKVVIKWNTKRFAIAMEKVSNPDYCTNVIMANIKKIDEAVSIPKLNSRSVGTCWILPAPGHDFTSIERKYREKMIVHNDIICDTYDSSIVLDIKAGEQTLHHQSGAMNSEQLQNTYLNFEADKVPETFLFLEASIHEKKVVQYSHEEMQSFLAKSLETCIHHGIAFQQIWEGVI